MCPSCVFVCVHVGVVCAHVVCAVKCVCMCLCVRACVCVCMDVMCVGVGVCGSGGDKKLRWLFFLSPQNIISRPLYIVITHIASNLCCSTGVTR